MLKFFLFFCENMWDLLFPRICVSCKEEWDYLCNKCKKELRSYPEICPFCYKFSKNYDVCSNCKYEIRPDIQWILIWFYYTDILKKLILKLKYNHKKDIANFLSDRLALIMQVHQKISHEMEKWNVIICSIPSHRHRKYFVKWYNQSELLSKKLAKNLGISYHNIFKKLKNTKSQVWLDRENRFSNLDSAFCFKKNFDYNSIKWKTIVLVDDITTTGATINEIAKLLTSAKLENKIYGLVVAKR